MKDHVTIDLDAHLDKEARAEMLGEARYEAAEMRDAAKDAVMEDIWLEVVLDFKEGYLAESLGVEMAESICDLYHSLPKENGLLKELDCTHTDKCAWDLIQAYRNTEEVKDILEYLWEQR